jgi:hypothetical protein
MALWIRGQSNHRLGLGGIFSRYGVSAAMTRTPARITQADVARAIRAAKQAGAGAVELLPDGTIRISLTKDKPETQDEPEKDVEL